MTISIENQYCSLNIEVSSILHREILRKNLSTCAVENMKKIAFKSLNNNRLSDLKKLYRYLRNNKNFLVRAVQGARKQDYIDVMLNTVSGLFVEQARQDYKLAQRKKCYIAPCAYIEQYNCIDRNWVSLEQYNSTISEKKLRKLARNNKKHTQLFSLSLSYKQAIFCCKEYRKFLQQNHSKETTRELFLLFCKQIAVNNKNAIIDCLFWIYGHNIDNFHKKLAEIGVKLL